MIDLLSRKAANLLSDERFAVVVRRFESACAASREHESKSAAALASYGAHGPLISGCVRSHFPEDVKDELRRLARKVTEESEAAWLARPPRIRQATIGTIARAIALRDGSGHYGPQPGRESN